MASIGMTWRADLSAGLIAAVLTLPICVASGVLAFAPLGPDYAPAGASAGLIGAIFGGAVSALLATSSFVVTSPRVSESLVLASLIVALSRTTPVANDKTLIIAAVTACVLLGGLWQTIFGLVGIAKVIKFTPHPVLVGFLNGVAVLIIISQCKPYLLINPATSNPVMVDKPWMVGLFAATAAVILLFPAVTKRLPGSQRLTRIPPIVIGFFGGIAAYYAMKALQPSLELGPTLGSVHLALLPPLLKLSSGDWPAIARLGVNSITISVVVAIVATLDSMLTFRTVQNTGDVKLSPVRDLLAQGLGNCVSAIAGGVTTAASPSATLGAYRAGGRSRITPITCALALLVMSLFLPNYLARIPTVVLSSILLAVGVQMFDRWTFEIVNDVRQSSSTLHRRRALYDLAVVFIVLGVTVFYSLVAGVIAGCLLAGIIFVMNMSRPIVRRSFSGADIQSKRIRPAADVAILNDTARQRSVLQLEGVLFFGNADDLSVRIRRLFQASEMIALDMRGVSDIDASGAASLTNLVKKCRELKKHLLFCEVPPAHIDRIAQLAGKSDAYEQQIKSDLDSALEWMEERSLQIHADKRSKADVLQLAEIDFLAGLDDAALRRLSEVLTERNFAAGEIICRRGDQGDRMWLLTKGSVSVRLPTADGRGEKRIASLARGTIIGEMALVETARRSATIVADEPVVCYELPRSGFECLLTEQPLIATKLLANLSRELARRLRRTSEDLSLLS